MKRKHSSSHKCLKRLERTIPYSLRCDKLTLNKPHNILEEPHTGVKVKHLQTFNYIV